jgi:hypothetical protein
MGHGVWRVLTSTGRSVALVSALHVMRGLNSMPGSPSVVRHDTRSCLHHTNMTQKQGTHIEPFDPDPVTPPRSLLVYASVLPERGACCDGHGASLVRVVAPQ